MEKQQELFTEFKDRETKKKFFGKGLLPDKTLAIFLTRERLILTALGFIVILAIMFAFGFECGKKTAAPPLPAVSTKERNLFKPALKSRPPEVKKEIPRQTIKPYTIQVATFKSKEIMQEEVAKLKSKGFSTTVIGINGLYEVWVGEYADMNEATKALSLLKKTYKDCLIRKR